MVGLISVIVTTYNWPAALSACLTSLLCQQDDNFEIIIADDGSSASTQQLISEFQRHSRIPIQHIHHEDKGFRAGTIRNKAAAMSRGDYLLFMDGDCVPLPSFISRHRDLAETGYFVPGNRVLVAEAYTHQVLDRHIALHSGSLGFFLGLWLHRRINRVLPLVRLPFRHWRYRHPRIVAKSHDLQLGDLENRFYGR